MPLPDKLPSYTGASGDIRGEVARINGMLADYRATGGAKSMHKKAQLAANILDASFNLQPQVAGMFNKGLHAALQNVANEIVKDTEGRTETQTDLQAAKQRALALPGKALDPKYLREMTAMSAATQGVRDRAAPSVAQKMLYLAHAHADSGDVFGYKAEGLSKSMAAGFQAKGIKDPQADVALMDAAIRPAEGGRPLCIYMRKQAREKFEVKADGLNHELKIGRSAMGSAGGDDTGRRYLFAIASAGDRVCAAPADITEGDALIKFINEDLNLDLGGAKPYLNHSSFFKGKPVTAAGEMLAKNGQLVDVNNATGHYKCKPKDLLAGARVLDGKGALNEETTVTVLLKGLPLPAGRAAPNRPYPPAAPDVALVFNAKEFAKKGFDAPAAVTENFESRDDYYKDYKPAASVKELQSRFKLSADLEPSSWVAAAPSRGSTVAIGGHRAGGGSAKPSPAAAASPGK